LAEKAGVSPFTITCTETSTAHPSLRTIRTLSAARAVDPLEVDAFRVAIEAPSRG